MKAFIIFLLAALPFCSMAQKAYETANYSGKVKGKTITLKLANGYIGASEIGLVTPHKPTLSFKPESGAPDSNNELAFKTNKATDGFFLLKDMQNAYDQLPVLIYGVYTSGNQSVPIKLSLDNNKI
jgi:hypothetical protein